jgi:putative endonuclease
MSASWSVYLIRARERVLYAGIAKDVQRRLAQHRGGMGAKFLRGRGPLQLVYSCRIGEQGTALRVERRIKSLGKSGKEALVRAKPSRARVLKLLGLPALAPLRNPSSRARPRTR